VAGGSPWRTVAAIASQTAALAAVLFYFGWASAGATFGYFGVDLSLLGFSTSDYLLRSIYSAYQPLLITGLAAVVALCAHQVLVGAVDGGRLPRARRLPPLLLALGVGVAAASALGLGIRSVARVLGPSLPAALAAGALLTVYADHLWPRLRPPAAPADPGRRLRTFLLVSLAVLGAFWWLALFAVSAGTNRAVRFASRLAGANEVAVYATRPLSLAGPGVAREVFKDPSLRYRYRYTGLRLLIRAGGQYFLLPREWVRGRDSVVALPQEGDVRLEIIASRG
jgi:hypothetical protein